MLMNAIGVLPPEQMRLLWQDFLTRQQLSPQIRYNYPQRRPIDEVSPHRVKVKNTEEETIPAYACMRITGVEVVGGQTCIKVEKPSSTEGEFLFNSQYAIEAEAVATETEPAKTGVGWAYRYGIVVALGSGTPPTAPNVQYRPVVDSWTIEEGSGFFTVFGEHEDATDAVIGRFDGGSAEIRWGKVTASAGCGMYTVELGKLLASSDTSGESDCEACGTITGEGESTCAQAIAYPAARVVGLGTSVTAYDPQSLLIPLRVGTDCIVEKIGGGGVEPLWGIVRGFQEHIVEYKERWDCCAPDGPPKLVGRTPVIFVGKECDEILCGECPA